MAVLPADKPIISDMCAQVKHSMANCHNLSFVPRLALSVAGCVRVGCGVELGWEFGVRKHKGIACSPLYMHTQSHNVRTTPARYGTRSHAAAALDARRLDASRQAGSTPGAGGSGANGVVVVHPPHKIFYFFIKVLYAHIKVF